MKEWARRFYASKEWKQCRAAFIVSVFGLCRRCPAPGKIVHHTVYLSPANINDPAVSLNHELLEYLCQDCHNREHFGSEHEVTAEGMMFDENGDLVRRLEPI